MIPYSSCKTCVAKAYQKNRTMILKKRQQRYYANVEKIRAQCREKYHKDIERSRSIARKKAKAARLRNPELRRVYSRRHYYKDHEKTKMRARQTNANNIRMLTTLYIRHRFGFAAKEVPTSVIGLKREQLKLHRLIGELSGRH